MTKAGEVVIVTDEGCDLQYAQIFPDEESFISWLEAVVDDHLECDRLDFLKSFVSVPELVDARVAEAMLRVINPTEERILCCKCPLRP